jgi:hypothetical protein
MNTQELALSYTDDDQYWDAVKSVSDRIANLGYYKFKLTESISKLSHSELAQLEIILEKLEG